MLMAGCAITSSSEFGPDGRAVHFIDGMSASVAYGKAAKFCPNGYDILGAPQQISVLDYTMTIECRAPNYDTQRQPEKSQPQAPIPNTRISSHPTNELPEKYSYVAEDYAKAQGCSPSASAIFIGRGPGYETYSIACENGENLPIRCDYGVCRTLK